MLSRGLNRRLQRIEAALCPNPIPFFRVEFYRKNEKGTLIHLDGANDAQADARYRMRVVFVDPPTVQGSTGGPLRPGALLIA